MTSLVSNLGGNAGFGEFSLARNDDGSTSFIDLQSIFGTQGINFFGHNYTGLYLNNNGSVTFNAATSSFTPSAITGSTSNPIIAAYWADVDTRGGPVAPTPGGTSTGTNLLWYDLDSTTHTFTATWDDVGYYSSATNKLNAFQLSIKQINDQGDFDIIFRYENVDWMSGSASGGSNGLGGVPARAGYSSGNGVEYFELPQSGDQAALLALESASNIGTPGTFMFQVRNGVPTVGISIGDASIIEGNGPTPHSVIIPVVLTEPSSSTITVHYTTTDGSALAGHDYVAQSGIVTFAPGVTQQNIIVAVTGDTDAEGDETFTVTLSNPSAGVSVLDDTATATIVNDDGGLLSIAAASADKAEGDSGATAFTFTVTRTGDTSNSASASWAVTGAAVIDSDFLPSEDYLSFAGLFSGIASAIDDPGFSLWGGQMPSGSVSFAVGENSKTVTVWALGDTVAEGDESFSVTLSNASAGLAIDTSSAVGTIRNDDGQATNIETAGSTDLVHVGSKFYLWDASGTGPSVKFQGGVFTAGEFGAWTPLGAEKTANGYLVAWQNGAADQFVVWDVDNNGNWKSQSGVVSGSSYALQSLETTLQQDLNHDGTTGLKTTTIEAAGGTHLDQVANEFFLHDAAGSGPSLKYAGSDVVAGEFGAWTPLGAEKTGTGYLVAWQNGAADQFVVWDVDNNGNWKSQSGVVSGSSYALQSLETTLQQDLNHDGTTGLKTTTIEAAGGTHLDQVANEFFLHDAAGSGPSLKYAGSDVVAAQFGAWTPLGAEKTANGYLVAWQNGAADQFVVWDVDNNGNWKSQSGVVSGSSYALQSLETTLQQDLNHDGTTGLKTTTIEAAGGTHLDQVANEFFLHDAAGSGPSLKYAGSDVVAGEFGAWTPLGAEKTGTGYLVAWQNGAADQFVVWDVDNNGNWKSQSGVVSGSSYALQSLETTLQQDLNHDGTTGLKTTTIEAAGGTHLDQVANEFFLHDAAGSGPSLKYAGSDVVAAQFGAWTPLGSEKTANGYLVAWQNGAADQFVVWDVDNNGNWKSQSGVVSGANPTLRSVETILHQDLNHDTIIG